MHRSTSRSRRPAGMLLTVAVVLLSGVSACSAASGSQAGNVRSAGAVAPGTTVDRVVPADVMSLPLLDQSGRSVTLASLRGQIVVVADFLTLCQEICPLTSANLRIVVDAVDRAGLAAKVQVLEVTVDPARDSPARLLAYQQLFGVRSNWSFLTGTEGSLTALWKWFGVGYQQTPEDPGPPPRDWLTGRALTYDIAHQDVVFVLGPDGHERWLVSGTPGVPGPSAVPTALQSFLNGEGLDNESAPPDVSWSPPDVEAAISRLTGTTVG